MIKVLKGMKDRYFEDIKKYDYIIDSAKNVFSKYGFEKIITPIVEETESKAILRLIKTDEPYNIGDLIAHKTKKIYKIAGENHIDNTDWLKVMILLTTEPTVHTLGTFSTISDNKQVNSSIIGYGSYIAASIYKGNLKGELQNGSAIPVSYRLV